MSPRLTRARNAVILAATTSATSSLVMSSRLPPPNLGEPDTWRRTNFRGATVDLVAGPAVATGIVVGGLVEGAGAGNIVATLGGAFVGRMDDLRGVRPAERFDKGLAGHLRALRAGRVSAGALKIGGLTAVGALVALVDGRRARSDVLLDAACIAGTANLVNLLDLRPGRALKAAAAASAGAHGLGARSLAVCGASVGVLPADLREQSMLGDAGANAVGAALGRSLVHRAPKPLRVALLALLTGVTLASERVSFSAVIDATPSLRALDQLGRRP